MFCNQIVVRYRLVTICAKLLAEPELAQIEHTNASGMPKNLEIDIWIKQIDFRITNIWLKTLSAIWLPEFESDKISNSPLQNFSLSSDSFLYIAVWVQQQIPNQV